MSGSNQKQSSELPDASSSVSNMTEEEIDYNIMGSFPASDPPSWTLGIRPHKKPSTEFEGEKPSANDPSHQNET